MKAGRHSGRGWAVWLPLALFAGFIALALSGLFAPAERDVQSAMIGRPLPEFALPPALGDKADEELDSAVGLSSAAFGAGQPRLLNIFASWCVPCAVEAPQLSTLAQEGIAIDGIAIRDRREDIAAFLDAHGNPYRTIGKDDVSKVQLAIGSSGVPETFVVDGAGIIRYQHIGPIMDRDIPRIISEWRKAKRPLPA
ncbi:redoxin domain-containing protein [Croceicoccus sp. F390]|uniref:Redoxin domain-containing protein n=1 Tax=Croceicoccus esteveae TaxID=3075597 RepID=A0ABU2ZJM4_9SPHN|nr:redoxin domain-containing protein [Croceicoccus sp. F390]MDT0576585.1 redoxin domain-containing protein [Croceicoccus sp. F390]